MTTKISKINSRASLDRSPKKNHVERAGGLPMYIRRIANHLHQEKGMSIGHAIATAKNAAAKMCNSGDLNFKGKQNVNAKSRAEACAAIADWNKRIAKLRIEKSDVRGRKLTDAEAIQILTGEDITQEIHKGCGCGMDKSDERVKADLRPKKKKVKKSEKPKPTGKKKTPKTLEISDEEFDDLAKSMDTVDFVVEGEIEKRNDEKQMVFGWASVAKKADGTVVVDKQGDVLDDIDQMEKVAYDFVLHSRDGGEMHIRKGVSTMIESFVATPEKCAAMGIPEGTLPVGWWVGFKVNDKGVWDKVKKGEYKMFSVHGSGLRKALED